MSHLTEIKSVFLGFILFLMATLSSEGETIYCYSFHSLLSQTSIDKTLLIQYDEIKFVNTISLLDIEKHIKNIYVLLSNFTNNSNVLSSKEFFCNLFSHLLINYTLEQSSMLNYTEVLFDCQTVMTCTSKYVQLYPECGFYTQINRQLCTSP